LRPLIHRRAGIEVNRHEGQLIQLGGEAAAAVNVAAGLARPQSQAQDGIVVECHRSGQRGDFAVVHHGQGDTAPRKARWATAIGRNSASSRAATFGLAKWLVIISPF
jgi:hypothetical protein